MGLGGGEGEVARQQNILRVENKTNYETDYLTDEASEALQENLSCSGQSDATEMRGANYQGLAA